MEESSVAWFDEETYGFWGDVCKSYYCPEEHAQKLLHRLEQKPFGPQEATASENLVEYVVMNKNIF